MKVIDYVNILKAQGHKVKYTIRKDGGIRITSIDKKSFRGSSGNVKAREMMGDTLSEAHRLQLEKIRTPKGKWGHKKLEEIPKEIKSKIRRLQRIWKKKGVKQGKPTIRNYRYVKKTYGEEESIRRLTQNERYASGYAYEENVDALLNRIALDLNKKDSKAVRKIYDGIKNSKDTFKEEWISAIYEIIYLWEQGQIDGEEALRRISIILNL